MRDEARRIVIPREAEAFFHSYYQSSESMTRSKGPLESLRSQDVNRDAKRILLDTIQAPAFITTETWKAANKILLFYFSSLSVRRTVFTMLATKETEIFRKDAKHNGALLDSKQREKLLKPYLPTPPDPSRPAAAHTPWQIRAFVRTQVHLLIFTTIHFLFSWFIRSRQWYHALRDRAFAILYYHHRAPELIRQDVRALSRLPEHLSVILELKGEERGSARLESLMDEVAEIAAWSACVGIPLLSIYEKTGKLL